jgi:hypothetical protein
MVGRPRVNLPRPPVQGGTIPAVIGRRRAWKRRQAEELLAIGVRQTDETPIVSTLAGTAMSPMRLDVLWREFTSEHDFDATFHTLRHSNATALLHAGVDVVDGRSAAGPLESRAGPQGLRPRD